MKKQVLQKETRTTDRILADGDTYSLIGDGNSSSKYFNNIAHNIYLFNTTVNGHKLSREEYIDYEYSIDEFKGKVFYEGLKKALDSHWGRKTVKVLFSSEPVKKKVKKREFLSAKVTGEGFLYPVIIKYIDLKLTDLEKPEEIQKIKESFENYLNPQNLYILDNLKHEYSKAGAKKFVAMLYALNNLGQLSRKLEVIFQNKSALHRAIQETFGKEFALSGLSKQIFNFRDPIEFRLDLIKDEEIEIQKYLK